MRPFTWVDIAIIIILIAVLILLFHGPITVH